MQDKIFGLKNQKGFTLVELLIVLALLGVAMAGVFQFLHYTQKSYALADTRTAVLQEIDLFFLQLEKDIRSASAPNSSTMAITVLNEGKAMDVYSAREASSADNSSIFTKTSYRLNGTDIQRGFATTDEASKVVGLNIDNWQTLVSYILPGDKQLFNDIRNDDVSTRRLIDVNVIVQHPKIPTSISMQTALLSRTGKSTTSIIESAASNTYIPVESITLTPASPLNLQNRNATTQSFTATVVPANATNKNLIWSQNVGSAFRIEFFGVKLLEPFVEFTGYSLFYDDGTFEIDDIDTKLDLMFDRFTTRSGKSVELRISQNPRVDTWFPFVGIRTYPREAKIEVRSPDGVKTTLTITQPSNRN